jgi:hypothetical protein
MALGVALDVVLEANQAAARLIMMIVAPIAAGRIGTLRPVRRARNGETRNISQVLAPEREFP